MEVLVLSEAQVRELIDPEELLDALADGFRALSAGDVVAPERNQISMPDEALLLSMPGVRRGGDMTVKVVTVYEQNVQKGLASHLATIALYDAATGACKAFMDGTYVTAIRTATAAALATRLLARKDARVLTILGAGVQGEHHLRTLPLVRDFDAIRIGSKNFEDAQRLATKHPAARPVEDFEEAVRDCDVVGLATHAGEPVIQPEWVRPGTHVSSVGYRPPRGELPRELAERARLFVETRMAFEPAPAGCAELTGLDPESGSELGEVLLGRRRGREARDEITVYKAMGHVMEDIVAAELVLKRARAAGTGQTITL